jgi:hypothetical protein
MDETLIAATFRIQDDKAIPGRDDSVSDFFYGKPKQSWCVNECIRTGEWWHDGTAIAC